MVAGVEDGGKKSPKWPIQASPDLRKCHLLGLWMQKANPMGVIVFCNIGELIEEAVGGIKQKMKHLGGNQRRSDG